MRWKGTALGVAVVVACFVVTPSAQAFTQIDLLTTIGESIADANLRELRAAVDAIRNDCDGEPERVDLRIDGDLLTSLGLRDDGLFDYHVRSELKGTVPGREGTLLAYNAENGSARSGEPFWLTFRLVGTGEAAGLVGILRLQIVVVAEEERQTLDVRQIALLDPCLLRDQPSTTQSEKSASEAYASSLPLVGLLAALGVSGLAVRRRRR